MNATQARKNFYQLLKQVSSGEQIVIQNTETGEEYQLIKNESKTKSIDKVALLNQFIVDHPVKLPDLSPEEIKKILSTRLDRNLP